MDWRMSADFRMVLATSPQPVVGNVERATALQYAEGAMQSIPYLNSYYYCVASSAFQANDTAAAPGSDVLPNDPKHCIIDSFLPLCVALELFLPNNYEDRFLHETFLTP